jgi:hypothetical protein
MDLALIAQLIAAGGVGGILVTIVGGSKDRREARRNFYKVLYTHGNKEGSSTTEEFHSAALMASIPRGLVKAYFRARYFAYLMASRANSFQEQTYDVTSSRDAEMHAQRKATDAQLSVTKLREIMIGLIWHPILNRLTWRVRCTWVIIKHSIPKK